MRHDNLADVFSIIKNTEAIGRKECIIPASNLIKNVLKIMENHKYIGEYKYMEDGKEGKFKIKLTGKINDCNVIKPRFSVRGNEFIKWEKRYLPANNIGILILTTDKGIMDQHDAKKEQAGGKLLGYVY